MASANPDYHGPAAAHGSVTWRGEASPEARLAALKAGEAQVANGLEQALSGEAPGGGVTLVDYLSPVAIIMMFNAASGPAPIRACGWR